jgi:molybdate transport system permease protein
MSVDIIEALLLSLKLSFLTTCILSVTAIPLGYVTSIRNRRWNILLEFFISIPLVFPPVILGFYLLLLFSPRGPVGKLYYILFSSPLAFSFEGILLAAYVYGFPHMYRHSKSAFSGLDPRYQDLARVLGKSGIRIFFSVVLPQTILSLLCSMLFCFSHILGAFGIIVMVGGAIPGKTKVASVMLFELVENFKYTEAMWFSFILVGISFLIMCCMEMIKRLVYANRRIERKEI